MAQSLPRVGVGRETEPRAAVGLELQRGCQRKEQAAEGFLLQELQMGLHVGFTN